MITKEYYEMLTDANKKGASLGPRDFAAMAEYEQKNKPLVMNYRYIPKQPVVEAFQLTRERWKDRTDWPWWLTQEAERAGHAGERGASFLRGWIDWDWWIVRKHDGTWEIWNPEQFAQCYVPYLGQRGSFGARDEG